MTRLAAIKSATARNAEKAEGTAFARAWKAARRPIASIERMPFAGHRNQAEVAADEARELRAA